MINILIFLVTLLTFAVAYLFLHLAIIKKEFEEIEREQVEQNKLIAQLIKIQDQQSDVIDYLIEKDDLLGRGRLIYPTIIGEA